MNFKDEYEFSTFKKRLQFLDAGSQGECYLDKKRELVYKLFFDCFEKDYFSIYKEEDILRFSALENSTFIWPSEIISCASELIGYIAPYERGVNLYKINPLSIDLDELELALKKAYQDVRLITDNGIVLYDVMYNILYGNSKLSVIDTLEYSHGEDASSNFQTFGKSIFYFLTAGYFDDFVRKDKVLSEIVSSDECDMLEFLKEFRNKISDIVGQDVCKLSGAKKLIRKTNNRKYIRELN